MDERLEKASVYRSTWLQLNELAERGETERYVECAQAMFRHAFNEEHYVGDDLYVKMFAIGVEPLNDAHRKRATAGAKGGRKKRTPSFDSMAYAEKARGKIEYIPAEKKA